MAIHHPVISRGVQAETLPSGRSESASAAARILSRPAVQKALALLTDLAAITLAHILADHLIVRLLQIPMNAQMPPEYHRYYIPYFALVLAIVGGYKSPELRRPEQELEQSCKAVAASFLGLVLFNFVVFKSEPFSRYLLVAWFVLSTILVVAGRFSWRGVYGMLWKRNLCQRRALLVGSASGISEYWQLLRTQRQHAYEYVGVLLDKGGLNLRSDELLGLPILGGTSEWESTHKELNADLLIVTQPRTIADEEWLRNLVHRCKGLHVDVELYSSVLATANLVHEHDEFSGCFRFYPRPEWSLVVQRVVKRTIDIIAGLIGSAVALLLVPLVFAFVKWEDRGPVFHLREYVGTDGRIHYYRKFRTMLKDADDILRRDPELSATFARNHKLKDDPRLLRLGRFMRRYSIDEFPQFFKVLTGELTFVGPRVICGEERSRYGPLLPKLLSAKPGLTGFWQVMGRQTTSYEDRVSMDMFYIERWSVWLDIVIIAKTFWKVIKAEGAY
ncbi:MAG: exopolysaccharide biosynthesis polyprenyl glycosylphosphotransferase [Candidatus Acidiferrales bacterium]